MAGARGLWRATGMTDDDFGKPIVAIVNSFTQFVPGHVHLKDLGQMVAREVEAAGGVVTDWQGRPVHNGGQVLAAGNAELHRAAMAKLNSA